jgi:5-methylcytosine-specific restriction protein A
MPFKPARPCKRPGCSAITLHPSRLCDTHLPLERRAIDARRGTPSQRGYDSHWQRVRTMFLAEHPLCVTCEAEGRVVGATEVHHIKPLADGGSNADSNLMALCKACHSKITINESGMNRTRQGTEGTK